MRVLVTGGCGFIGSHICDALANEGNIPLALDDLSTGKRENVTCEVAQVDILDKQALDDVFLRFAPEIVIHAAAQAMLRDSLRDPIEDAQRNIIGTLRVLEACREHGVRRIMYTSTGGARYGEKEDRPSHEEDVPHPIAPYGLSKLTAERYIEMYSLLFGMEYTIFCFGNVYGPRDNPDTGRVITTFICDALHGRTSTILGDGTQTRDFLYVDDVARTVAHCASHWPPSRIYNLGSGERTSVNALFGMIKTHIPAAHTPRHLPKVQGEVLDNELDYSRARKELGFVPTSLAKGLPPTIVWYGDLQRT